MIGVIGDLLGNAEEVIIETRYVLDTCGLLWQIPKACFESK
jgi:hypothetical protein